MYQRYVMQTGKEPQFLVLAFFLIVFASARGLALAIRCGRLRLARNVVVGELHVHHYVWGIALLLLSGYLAVVLDARPRGLLSALFGAGAALTLDEFALWLHLEDVYWQPRGRRSLDVVVVTVALLALFILHAQFWTHVPQSVVRLTGVAI